MVANAAAVPITSALIMPAGMAAVVLMPLGLDGLAFAPMGWGVEAVLAVARTVAAWPGAAVPAPPIGAAALVRRGLRHGMALPVADPLALPGRAADRSAALAIGVAERPPDILVSADARLIALRAGDELFLQRLSGASNLTRDAWLRLYAREPAAVPLPRWGRLAGGDIACEEGACTLRPSSGAPPAVLLRGAPPNEACAGAALVVSAEPVRGRCAARVVDRFSVWRDGAHAVWLDKTGPRVLSDRALRGARPWVPPVPKPRNAANAPRINAPRGAAATARARASAVRSGVVRTGIVRTAA